MSYCKIFLDGDRDVYSPGDAVGGYVVCHINSTKNIRGVVLKVHGKEHTRWRVKRGKNTTTYTGENSLWEETVVLVEEGTLQNGDYRYPFIFRAPPALPSTYKNVYGYIKYYLKVKIDIPYGFDYEDEKPFTMCSPIDLNELHISTIPVNVEDEKEVCCWCCTNGTITTQMQLPTIAFAKHETFNVKVYVLNMSNVNVDSVYAKIKMKVEAKATSPSERSRFTTDELLVTKRNGIGAHGDCTYSIQLDLPENTTIPNFQGCKLFSKNCYVQVQAVLPSCHKNAKVKHDIIIGDIALRDPFMDAFAVTTIPSSLPNAPVDDTIPTAPPSDTVFSEHDNLPPSYDEALRVFQRRETTL